MREPLPQRAARSTGTPPRCSPGRAPSDFGRGEPVPSPHSCPGWKRRPRAPHRTHALPCPRGTSHREQALNSFKTTPVFSVAGATATCNPPAAFSVRLSHQEGDFIIIVILSMGKLRHLGSKLAFPAPCNAPGPLWRRRISITPRFCCMHDNFSSLPTAAVMKHQGSQGEGISFARAAEAVGKSSFYAKTLDLTEP